MAESHIQATLRNFSQVDVVVDEDATLDLTSRIDDLITDDNIPAYEYAFAIGVAADVKKIPCQ